MASLLTEFVDLDQPSLYSESVLKANGEIVAAGSILFNPLFWKYFFHIKHQCLKSAELLFLSEYKNKTITRLFGGNSLYGCYGLAVAIFSLGILRDFLYERALREQPTYALLTTLPFQAAAYGLLAAGNILVLSSMWALGLTGTYLGDYFGILMDDMVTGFPFNVVASPMYYGSTMSFLGSALLYGRPAGILLTAEVLVVYLVALSFEDPFTSQIYAKREAERKKVSTKKASTKKSR